MSRTRSGKLLSHYCLRRRKPDLRCGQNGKSFSGIFYQLKNGCNWSDLPRDLPPYSTVFWHYQNWCEDGVLDRIMTELHSKVREQVKKKPQWTTLIMIICNKLSLYGSCQRDFRRGIKEKLIQASLSIGERCNN